jgi:uncharacterized protein YndB with AHSA1/START domain
MQINSERYIDAMSEQVWMMVSSVECMPRWLDFARKAELVEGDGVGRTQRVEGPWHPLCTGMVQEVTVYEPARVLEWRIVEETRALPVLPRMSRETSFTITLTPEAGGTRVLFATCQEPAGPLRGAAMRLVGHRLMQRHIDRSLEKLERLVRGR